MTPAILFLLIAVIFIATELLIMQFSIFWFFIMGLGALAASLVAWLFPGLSWTVVTGLFVVMSAVSAGVLLPILKRWQAKPAVVAGHDAIGQRAEVLQPVSSARNGRVMWSGTEWSARTVSGEADFQVGETAIIREVDGITLIVGH
ncbi:MAG: Unknown protein [uncultured Thiotrichaceae bacterium]|uniref:NfeD-like C-terminal domain-containing protein n=1 Tax=uncultured Thiotrichaceae bacterium TaxID=298394 RepID=A0A6S6SXJ3_9GAMM|nr:MAG: Unknown protein [uncultured Thiotrichaceae bacterium]